MLATEALTSISAAHQWGPVIMKTSRSTSTTSTRGVTLISPMAFGPRRDAVSWYPPMERLPPRRVSVLPRSASM
jgi:hypothetical protein